MKDIDKLSSGIEEISSTVANALATEQAKVNAKVARINAMRAEASRKASMANKRIARLEKNNLKDSPAYQQYLKSGGKFGVRGKDYNGVQKELARLNRFLESTTSTVRGSNKLLKDMAKNTGTKYKTLKDLRAKSKVFFELHSKTEQYLRHVHDMGSAIGYQKIWQQINTYVKDSRIDLTNSRLDVEQMVEAISEALVEWDDPIKAGEGFSQEFYHLPKE